MPRKKRKRVRRTDAPETEYGRIGRTKRLLLAALKVWECKNFGTPLKD